MRDGIVGNVDSTSSVTNMVATGNVDLGDASGDSVSITGTIDTDVLWGTTKKAGFRDSGIYLQSSVDGVLDIVSDTTVAVSGAVTMDSTLGMTGSVTLGANADLVGSSTSDITINTTAFTVAGATGNVSVGGTFAVTGTSVFTGGITCNGGVTLGAGDDLVGSSTSDITINTTAFTVAGATGNTSVGGTLGATGLSTLTGGATIGGALIQGGTGAITATSGAGAVAVTGQIHQVTTTGTGDALTLANGTAGQRLCVIYVAEGAGGDTAVITPTTLAGGATITLTALGDSCDLVYSSTGGWYVLGLGGSAAVA